MAVATASRLGRSRNRLVEIISYTYSILLSEHWLHRLTIIPLCHCISFRSEIRTMPLSTTLQKTLFFSGLSAILCPCTDSRESHLDGESHATLVKCWDAHDAPIKFLAFGNSSQTLAGFAADGRLRIGL